MHSWLMFHQVDGTSGLMSVRPLWTCMLSTHKGETLAHSHYRNPTTPKRRRLHCLCALLEGVHGPEVIRSLLTDMDIQNGDAIMIKEFAIGYLTPAFLHL